MKPKYWDFNTGKYLQGSSIAPPNIYEDELRLAPAEDQAKEKLRLIRDLEHMSKFPSHYPETIESIKGTLAMLAELEKETYSHEIPQR